MQTNEQRRLYEELELINRQEPEIKTSRVKGLLEKLQTKWQSAIAFLTQDSEPQAAQESEPETCPTDFGWWYTFGWQAGQYALMSLDLSSEEDVKTWLEQNYNSNSKNNPRIIW